MHIALCICTRNRAGDLRRALESVARSEDAPPLQVIVSDDSNADQAAATRQVCSEFAAATYLRGPQRGLSANRNNCIESLAPGVEAVSFIDDDVVVAADFLRRIAETMAVCPPNTIVTGAERKSGDLVTPLNCSFWGYQNVEPQGARDYHSIVINATLFPRRLFESARFDEALQYGSEEIDMCAQAEALGYSIEFDPEIVNDHFPSPVNRAEYARFVEASRFYSTYKRYRWLEHRPAKAAAFACLAPAQVALGFAKRRRWREIPALWPAVRTAVSYARGASRARQAVCA